MYKKIGLEIIEKLNNHGFEAYFVGGFVRDHLLNRTSNDIDITTNATPSDIINLFDKVNKDGIDYYSLKVNVSDFIYEITSYRSDISYDDNRHPKVKLAESIEEDLKRRDFTINALAMDKYGNIIDLFGGICDLNNQTIKIIGDGNVRFKEDSLRILRACYFRAKLGFDIDLNTIKSMELNSYLTRDLSHDIVKRELQKIFNETGRFLGIESLILSKTAYHLGFEKTLKYVLKHKPDVSFDDVLIISSIAENFGLTKTKYQNKLGNFLKNYINIFNPSNNYLLYKLGKKNLTLLIHALNVNGASYNLSQLMEKYDNLSIHSFDDVSITPLQIKELFNVDGANLGRVIEEVEMNIVNDILENDKDAIISFIKKDCIIIKI